MVNQSIVQIKNWTGNILQIRHQEVPKRQTNLGEYNYFCKPFAIGRLEHDDSFTYDRWCLLKSIFWGHNTTFCIFQSQMHRKRLRKRVFRNRIQDGSGYKRVSGSTSGIWIQEGQNYHRKKLKKIEKNFMFEDCWARSFFGSLHVLCRGLIGHIWKGILNQKFFFILKKLGLDPDWIWIQQQPGSGSGCSKMYGSGSGFGEYGSETLGNIKTCLPAETESLRWSNQRFIICNIV